MNTSSDISDLRSLYLGPVEVWDEFCRAWQAYNLILNWKANSLKCLVFQGGTGVGKSSWINHFAGQIVSKVSPVRPCTAIPLFLCSASKEDLLRKSLNSVALDYWAFDIKICEFSLPENWVVVDCPDYDSLELGHHALSRFMTRISSANLLITSPAKYGDELTISALQYARDLGSPCKLMVNKWDTVPTDQLDEFKSAVEGIYQRFWPASAQINKDIGEIRANITRWIQEIDESDDCSKNSLTAAIEVLNNCCQESYGQRCYEINKLSEQLSNDYKQFWERHQLIQLKIEKTLKQSLSQIAEEKIFYFSKFITKHLFSFMSSLNPATNNLRSSKNNDPFEHFAREIRENLKVCLQQNQKNLADHYPNLQWLENYPSFDLDEKLKDFDSGFSALKADIFKRLSEKFSKNAGSKHSIMAVSQEVLLSLIFYSFLGPIALLPGWEQVLSGLCYMIYGKIPSAHLPTVMYELEQMNDECRENFEQFLIAILEDSNKFLLETEVSLQRDHARYLRIVNSYKLES